VETRRPRVRSAKNQARISFAPAPCREDFRRVYWRALATVPSLRGPGVAARLRAVDCRGPRSRERARGRAGRARPAGGGPHHAQRPAAEHPAVDVCRVVQTVGYTCSNRDRHAEKLAIELLPKDWPRVFSIGRLDRDSEGLLLITNDGHLAQKLAHPRHKIPKTYEVSVAVRWRPRRWNGCRKA